MTHRVRAASIECRGLCMHITALGPLAESAAPNACTVGACVHPATCASDNNVGVERRRRAGSGGGAVPGRAHATALAAVRAGGCVPCVAAALAARELSEQLVQECSERVCVPGQAPAQVWGGSWAARVLGLPYLCSQAPQASSLSVLGPANFGKCVVFAGAQNTNSAVCCGSVASGNRIALK
jgi:hypothetical protein